MTTIIAKPHCPSIRIWERDDHNTANEVSGQNLTLIVDFSGMRATFGNETLFIPAGVSPIEKTWLIPTLQKISELPFNTDNWSTGAKRTERVSFGRLLKTLSQILPDDAPAPAIIPTWLGGAQAEWHRKGIDLEICANPGGAAEYFFCNGDDEREGIARDDWAELKQYARAIV